MVWGGMGGYGVVLGVLGGIGGDGGGVGGCGGGGMKGKGGGGREEYVSLPNYTVPGSKPYAYIETCSRCRSPGGGRAPAVCGSSDVQKSGCTTGERALNI